MLGKAMKANTNPLPAQMHLPSWRGRQGAENKPRGIDGNLEGDGKHLSNQTEKCLDGRKKKNPGGNYDLQNQASRHNPPIDVAAIGAEQVGEPKNPGNSNQRAKNIAQGFHLNHNLVNYLHTVNTEALLAGGLD